MDNRRIWKFRVPKHNCGRVQKSGFQFTSQINLTRGVTTENFADVQVGINIIVPGIRRRYGETEEAIKQDQIILPRENLARPIQILRTGTYCIQFIF